MKKNMGNTDRIIRTMIAVLIAGLWMGGVIEGTLAIVLLAVSGIFLLTSLVSFCPLYTLVGINSCPVKSGNS